VEESCCTSNTEELLLLSSDCTFISLPHPLSLSLSLSSPPSLSLSRQRLPEAGKTASWTRSRYWKLQGPKT
jgi:hypothetical protein